MSITGNNVTQSTPSGVDKLQILQDARAQLQMTPEQLEEQQLKDRHMQEILKRADYDESTGAVLFKSSFQPVILSKMQYDAMNKQIDKLSDELQKSKDKVEELSSLADDWEKKYYDLLRSSKTPVFNTESLRQGGGRPVLFDDYMKARAIVEYVQGKSYSEISNILTQEVRKQYADDSKEISVSSIQKFLRVGNRGEVNSFLMSFKERDCSDPKNARNNSIAYILRGIRCVPDGNGGLNIVYNQ